MAHVEINGARLWYEVTGPDTADAAPLLLHHGYTASRVNWQPVAERLQSRYRIIMLECRGTGASEHTEHGYCLEQVTQDVVGLLDHLGLERVTYAGHSMGGGVGYLLGLEYPQRLEKLILMAPIPSGGTGEITAQLREERMAERRSGDREAILARYRAMRFREDVETDAWFEIRADHILAVSDGHFEGFAEAMQDFDVADRLAGLATPTLMIAGGVDSLLHANLADFAALPNATIEVIARAGHEVAVHEPERVAAVIDAFMRYGVVNAEMLQAALDSNQKQAK